MNKKIRFFLVGIAAVLVGATILFLTVNNSFVSPYYINQKREELGQVCKVLSKESTPLESYIEYAETHKSVVIAVVPNTGDIDGINEELREAFLAKGLGLSRYWLWQEDYHNTIKNKTQQRVYGQGNLGYSLLVQYMIKGDLLIAVTTVIPHLSPLLTIANTVSAVIMGATALLLMALVWWMSSSLQKAQRKVAYKNEQMKQLLNNVSHDLKTPIALIKAYTAGMKDGMDDGSFLETVVEQNNRMEQLTLRLLELSRCEEIKYTRTQVDISSLLSKELDQQMPLFAERNLLVERNIPQGICLQTNPETLTTIIDNLLSNAIKYSTDSPVSISLHQESAEIVLEVKNMTDLPDETKTELLWEPFCVAESSRNSAFRGGGLGLSLVRAATNAIGGTSCCKIVKGQFSVRIQIKLF